MYYDEDLLLDLRLNFLDKFVKKFVISEATYTHNGNKKKLKFDINNYRKFKDKINYIVVDEQPNNILKFVENEPKHKRGEKLILNGMARDYFQRENLRKGLTDLSGEDLVLISDLDEIPNLQELNFSEIKNNILIFEQKMFYYKFNLYYDQFKWYKKVKYKIITAKLRNIKGKKYPKWRIDTYFQKKYSNLYFKKWYFTCLKTPEELEKKLTNFAHHYEFEESGLKLDDLKKLISEKRVMYDHTVDQKGYKWSGKSTLQKVKLNFLPDYISNNILKYKDWID